jgi:hypothetical protein
MARDLTKSLSLATASAFLEANGLGAEAERFNVAPEADRFIRRAKKGEAIEVLRARDLLERFIAEQWPHGATAAGKRKMDWYLRGYLGRAKRPGPEGLEPADDEDEEKVSDAEEFQILEKELQSYLAKNLALVEAGMTLWKSADGQSAIEFVVDEKGRKVDILAKDRSGTPVVIELKASSGHERVIGQALYYRECIKEKFNAPKVRTFIIAREISDEVRIASRAVPDVELFEYKLSMTLAKI